MPISFIVAMIGLVLWDHVHRLNTLAIVLTTLTLLAGVGRLALTFFPLTIHIDRIGVENPPLFPSGYVIQVARIDAELSVGAPKRRRKDDRENGRGRSVSGRKSHIRYARWQESAEADT